VNKNYVLILGGISFGTTAIFIKFSEITPGSIAFFRFLIAGLILSLGKIGPKKIIKYSPFGLLLSLHMITFILGVYNTTIIDATVLVSTSPFLQYYSFHLKAKRIMEDSARKIGKWVVDVARDLGANVIKLENLKDIISHVNNLLSVFRDKLYLMQYRRIQDWIEWQARKHGLIVEYVPAFYSSVTCPKCGKKMKETSHRWFSRSCGYENDLDVIAIANLWEGVSSLLTARGEM